MTLTRQGQHLTQVELLATWKVNIWKTSVDGKEKLFYSRGQQCGRWRTNVLRPSPSCWLGRKIFKGSVREGGCRVHVQLVLSSRMVGSESFTVVHALFSQGRCQRRILGGGWTGGVSFWPFPNSSGWWRLISSLFLTRTSCAKTSHADGYYGAWPGWAVSIP